MTDSKIDIMMKAYVNPDVEPFSFNRKNHRGLKAASVIAAALVLTILSTLIIPSLTDDRHSFVLTVNAASDRAEDGQIGTVYSEHSVYDKDMNPVDRYYVMDAELILDGDHIEDVSFRSINGFGRFFVMYNPDPDDYHDDVGWWCDAEGKLDTDYVGWRTYDYDEYYNKAEINETNDWSVPSLYHIQYTATNDDDRFLQPDEASSERDDIIEITVTFSDGAVRTRRLSVTYPDGMMTVKEIK